jgi:hypothetical protein
MKVTCPQCGSREFRKLSLVYAEGFSKLKTGSRGWGIIAGTGGADLAFGRLRTRGGVQTALSRKAAAPSKMSHWKIFRWALVGLFILVFSIGYTDTFLLRGGRFELQFGWFVYPYLWILLFILCFVFWYNRRVVPRRYRLWDRSFMCYTCGHILQLPEQSELSNRAFAREV